MRKFLAMAVLAVAFATCGEAKSQDFIRTGPDGSIGIRNPNGTYTYIYPNRLNPAANWALPGSTQHIPNGNVWVGWDGQVHGNLVDPSTGDIHLRKVVPGNKKRSSKSTASTRTSHTNKSFRSNPYRGR